MFAGNELPGLVKYSHAKENNASNKSVELNELQTFLWSTKIFLPLRKSSKIFVCNSRYMARAQLPSIYNVT